MSQFFPRGYFMKFLKKIIGISITVSQFVTPLALAVETKVTPLEIIQHLDDKAKEFDKFYRDEQRWIKAFLMPVVSDLINSRKKLSEYDQETKSWGSLQEIENQQSVMVRIRAQKILTETSRDFALLFIAHLNLQKASEKHRDQIRHLETLVLQNTALYQSLVVKLQSVLSIFEKYDFENRYQAIISDAQKSLLDQKRAHNLAVHQVLENEINQIDWLLDSAERRQSRYSWFSAQNAYLRLLDRARKSGFDANRLEQVYKEIRQREVSAQDAKAKLFNRIEKIKTGSLKNSSFEKSFVEFLINPNPSMESFRLIEAEIAKLEFGDFSASLFPKKSSSKRESFRFCMGPPAPLPWDSEPHKPGEERKQFRVYERDSSNSQGGQERHVIVESYTTDWTGNSELRTESFKSDSSMIDRIRNEFGLGPNDLLNSRKGFADIDPNFGVSGELGSITRPKSFRSPKSKVTVNESGNKTEYNVDLAPQVTPDAYKDRPQKIYAGHDFERSDMQASAEDLAEKTKSFNKEISKKSQDLAQQIDEGERALASSFRGIMDHLGRELQNAQDQSEIPDAAPGAGEPALRQSIKTTRQVITILSQSNESNPAELRRQVQQGLDVASKLVDSAELALKDEDAESAQGFLQLSHDIIREYGANALRLAISFSPAGDVVDLVELVSGKDAFSDEKLSIGDRVMAGMGIIIGSRVIWKGAAKYFGETIGPIFRKSSKFGEGLTESEKFGPLTKKGPMHELVIGSKGEVAGDTFRSGNYRMNTYNRPQKAYRVTHENGSAISHFYTPEMPAGPTSAITDLALSGAKNPAVKVFEVEIPANTRMGIGIIEKQGHLPGGGIQIVIEDPSVIKIVKEVKFQ